MTAISPYLAWSLRCLLAGGDCPTRVDPHDLPAFKEHAQTLHGLARDFVNRSLRVATDWELVGHPPKNGRTLRYVWRLPNGTPWLEAVRTR